LLNINKFDDLTKRRIRMPLFKSIIYTISLFTIFWAAVSSAQTTPTLDVIKNLSRDQVIAILEYVDGKKGQGSDEVFDESNLTEVTKERPAGKQQCVFNISSSSSNLTYKVGNDNDGSEQLQRTLNNTFSIIDLSNGRFLLRLAGRKDQKTAQLDIRIVADRRGYRILDLQLISFVAQVNRVPKSILFVTKCAYPSGIPFQIKDPNTSSSGNIPTSTQIGPKGEQIIIYTPADMPSRLPDEPEPE